MSEDLQKVRKRKGVSIKQLASKSGISIATIVQYENGARRISPTDLRRLAKALYVGEWDINPHSAPPPPAEPTPPRERRRERPPRPEEAPPKAKKARPKSPPARETQIVHLLALAARFGTDRTALEAEIGKPLEEMTQAEARTWNGRFMRRMAEEKPTRPIDRRRAYLPEGVDGFEMAYLQEQQEAGVLLDFTLFDRRTFAGVVIGFSPYQITIREPGGDEVTLNKLAVAYWRKAGGGT